MSLKELNQKRTEIYGQIRKYADDFNANDQQWKDAEHKASYEKANADYDAVMEQIEQAQESDSIAARLTQLEELQGLAINPRNIGFDDAGNGFVGKRPAPGSGEPATEQDRALAMAGWFRAQLGKTVDERHHQASQKTGIPIYSKGLDFALPPTHTMNALRAQWLATPERDRLNFEFNAPLTSTTGSSGGNIIPPETMLRMLEVNMLAFGAVRQVAEQILTTSGEDLSWPTADDTGNSGRRIAESTAADDNAGGGSTGDGGPNPTFAKTVWGAYKYTSDTILVPYELLEDTFVDLPGVIGAMLGERLGRITNTEFTTGTGSSQPSGIVTGATLGVTAAATGAITADEVIDLEHSVDPAYRNGAGYMMNDATLLSLRKLKDNEGRYLWQSGFNGGAPDTLNNRPFTVNQQMASMAANAYPLIFGQLSKYKVRRVNRIRMYRLEERYRERDQDGFVAFVREDGGILDAGTPPIKKLRNAAS